ncbi:MAG TPA: SNF2-related protein [Microthrixaceae bacterium]|nr:SNF2-related protein [Microthrixaceae bacterium]
MNATQSHLTALRAIARSIDGEPVTAEEMEAVAAWRGWGPAAKMLENHSPHRSEIIATLDEEQLEAAKRATTTAFYTPPWLVASIWSGVRRSLGFTGGRVLEAGCGSGLFFDDAVGELVGVEADPVTAEAARLRHPEATIVTSRFERFTAPAGSFDLVIGNVPFGKDTPYDPIDNPAGLAIHNYFIAKALRLVRPGGVVAVVTSRFTLDAGTTKARDEIARWGSLLGVVRFPEGTFADMGTNVVADLLIFRRDDTDGSPRLADASWRASTKLAGRYDLEIPRYMRNRDDTIPTMNTLFDVGSPTVGVVGELVVGSGMYGSGSVTWRLERGADVQREVTKTVARVFDAVAATHTFDHTAPLASFDPTAATPDTKVLPGTIRIAGSGFERFTAIDGWIGHDAGREAAELTALIELRDAVRTMLDDRDGRDNVVELHAAYTKRWGSLRRVGGTATAPRYPKLGGFRVDPGWPLVASLEIGLTAPAPEAEVVVTDLASAIAVSLDRTGGLDVDLVAELLDWTADSVHEQLTDKRLAFADPLTGRWMMADEYLSGDVRTRHAQAVAAGAEPNISALAEVVPADATPEEVAARLGAAWIAPEIIAAFVNELVSPGCYGGGIKVEHAAEVGQWKVVPGPRKDYSTSLTAGTWGTPWMDTFDIVQGMLNMSALRVWESIFVNGAELKRIDNAATEAVNEKAAEIAERFGEWVWEDPDRTETLLAEFNRRFRSHRGRNFDGSHQTFPGLNPAFVPHDHQRDVVWRVVASGNTLIGHDVGAGKTASLIMSAMESRRLGLVNKPMIVVPNHMLEQFTADFMSLYPKANVLAAGRHETSASERAEFVAAAAIGDWDAIVCTHNAFGRIGLSDESMANYIRDEIAWFDAAIGENAEQRSVVKAIERRKRALEAKLERLVLGQQRDDTAVSFEDLQVDALWVDEAHRYKNLAVNTRSDIATGNPSKTASDLDAKLAWIRSTYDPNRAIVFATGTPISNTLAELWVVHHYVDPASLEEAGLAEFDTWLATFAEVVTGLEMDPSGTGWRMKSRIARFSNAPEMVLMFSRFADIQTHEDLDLALPDCTRSIETVDCSPELAEAMEQFMERADQIRARMVKPDEDNFLKLSTDARHASLDPRLVGLDAPSDGGKIGRCVDRCTRNRHGLQIVFCDLGTPGSTRFDMYAELRSQLVARGFESDRIRFVQDAKTDKAKESLFAACRNGDVDVVIGSTGTFGEGTNIQDRVTAIHHLDAPWRPSDIRQREGRGVRQGNPNHVRIYRYVVTGSFDAFMWGTLERKARFIEQVYRSEARAIEDVDGDAVFTFAEVKAVASGNPALLRRAELENLIAKHRRSRTGHIRTNRHRRSMIKDLGVAMSNNVRHRDGLLILEHIDGALNSNPAFARRYSSTPFDAEEMAIEVLGGRDHQVMVNSRVTLTMRRRGARRIDAEFSFNYDPLLTFEVSARDLRDEAAPTLHHLWATFLNIRPGRIAELDEEIATTEAEIASLTAQSEAAWAGDGELAALEAELVAIDEELRQASVASVGSPTDRSVAEAADQSDEALVA